MPFVRITALAMAIVVGLLFGARSASAGPKILTGTIAKVDPGSAAIAVRGLRDERLVELRLANGVRISVDRSRAEIGDLAAGMKATLFYDDETNLVSSVRALTSTDAAKPPRPRTPVRKNELPVEAKGDVAGDWPQWRGPRQDGVSLETGLLESWPAVGPPQLWSVPVGEGYSSMSVAAGRLWTMDMAGGQQRVRCFDTESGRDIWSQGIEGQYQNSFGSGPRATPTIEGDRVYAQGAQGTLACLDAATGRGLWRANLLEDLNAENITWGISGSPVVVGDRVWVNPGVAYDKRTGKLVGKAVTDSPGYATPLVGRLGNTEFLAIFTATALVGVDPEEGRTLFRHNWRTDYDCNIATPILSEERLFISSGYGSGCALLSLSSRGASVSAEEVYRNKEMRNHFSTCVLSDGHLYGFDERMLVCLDFSTGENRWTQRGFNKGSLTLADGKLYILGESGRLALVRPNPQRYEEISSFQPLDGKCWSAPVVAGGKLYVRNEQVLKCYDLRR